MKMPRQTRREFLHSTGAVVISAIVPQLGCDSNEVDFLTMPTAPDMDLPADMPKDQMPDPPITSNSRFYLQSINGQNYDPTLSAASWSTRIILDTGRASPRASPSSGRTTPSLPSTRASMRRFRSGTISRIRQTAALRGNCRRSGARRRRPSRCTESPWPVSARSSSSRSVPTVAPSGRTPTSPPSHCPMSGSPGDTSGPCRRGEVRSRGARHGQRRRYATDRG